MQVFVCVCAHGGLFAPSTGVWLAPVCPASHLSPLQDKGSSISEPLLRLLEMIWSVLLSTEKIISSQRGRPSSLRASGGLWGRLQSPCVAWVTSRSDGHTEMGNQKRGGKTVSVEYACCVEHVVSTEKSRKNECTFRGEKKKHDIMCFARRALQKEDKSFE